MNRRASGGGSVGASPPAAAKQNSWGLLVLLPPGPSLALREWRPVAVACEAALARADAARARAELVAVNVVPEAELGGVEVLELLGGPAAAVEVPVATRLPRLTLHVKDVGRFFSVAVALVDARGEERELTLSNRASAVRVSARGAALPLVTPGVGWARVSVDLDDACRRCFGAPLGEVRCVTLLPSARYARAYFEARPLADAELPAWMRTM